MELRFMDALLVHHCAVCYLFSFRDLCPVVHFIPTFYSLS